MLWERLPRVGDGTAVGDFGAWGDIEIPSRELLRGDVPLEVFDLKESPDVVGAHAEVGVIDAEGVGCLSIAEGEVREKGVGGYGAIFGKEGLYRARAGDVGDDGVVVGTIGIEVDHIDVPLATVSHSPRCGVIVNQRGKVSETELEAVTDEPPFAQGDVCKEEVLLRSVVFLHEVCVPAWGMAEELLYTPLLGKKERAPDVDPFAGERVKEVDHERVTARGCFDPSPRLKAEGEVEGVLPLLDGDGA